MCAEAYPRLRIPQRRRALELGYANAALWAAGNGLTTGPLVYYLAQDLGASGFQLSLLLATPNLAGLLRLFAPAAIDRAGSAKRACLWLSLFSYLTVIGLPLAGIMPMWLSRSEALVVLLVLLCSHMLLDCLANVALWSWLADIVPLRIRGRYFSRRQIWLLIVEIPLLVGSGYFSDWWREHYSKQPNLMLLGYALPNLLGAVCLMGSLVPLILMPATPHTPDPTRGAVWRAMATPFRDRRFRPVLIFRVWLAFANGITQSVQGIYPKRVLHLGVGDLGVMNTTMRFGQIGGSRWIGPFSDRYGNRPVLIVGQICVTASLLFFIAASPANRATAWIVLGAWVLWSGYAAHNICLPNLVLKLATYQDKASYIATNEALASVTHATATVLGGLWFDHLTADNAAGPTPKSLMPFMALFWTGFALRGLAVPLLSAIIEPGAWRWPEILRGRRNSTSLPSTGPDLTQSAPSAADAV